MTISGFSAVNDTVSLSDTLVVESQSIGVSNRSTGFSNYDGILGLGPVAITDGTVTNRGQVPTLTNNLLAQGKIPQEIVGISFAPTTTEPNANGVMTLGGTDEGLYEGEITYVGISGGETAKRFWGIDVGCSYGNGSESKEVLAAGSSGIVDTGSECRFLSWC